MSDVTMIDAFAAWADCTADENGAAVVGAAGTLTELLTRDADARAEFVECALLEVALHRAHRLPPPPPDDGPNFRPRPWRPVLLLVLATACGVGVVAWHRGARPPVDAGVRHAVARGAGGAVPDPTDVAVAGAGPAEVHLRDGSRIVAGPGTRMRIQPLDGEGHGYRLELRAGAAEFDLVPGCRPFTVVTPFGSLRALGPQFTVSVNAAERSVASDGPMKPSDDRLPADAGYAP